jgi:hypothetical protein
MSWTLDLVADAKWSATGFPRVASCLWHTLLLVDDFRSRGRSLRAVKSKQFQLPRNLHSEWRAVAE